MRQPQGKQGDAGAGESLTVKIGWRVSAETPGGRAWISVCRDLFPVKESARGTGLNVIATTFRPAVYGPGKTPRLRIITPAALGGFFKARRKLGLF